MTFLCSTTSDLPWLTDEDRARDFDTCCYGAAMGPGACTCWEPIFDLEQHAPRVVPGPAGAATRAKRCHDCAFRPDSPERLAGEDPGELENFFCHQGIRRALAYRHPDGRVRPLAYTGDYQPLIVHGVPYRADGTPGEMCAGWAQANR